MQKVRAFTLVELLVVISIIALLLSILMPSLSKARKSAKQVVCCTNLKQINMALDMYTEDNGGNYPQWYGYQEPYVHWNWTMYLTGRNGRASYLPAKGIYDTHNNVFVCPALKKSVVSTPESVLNWTSYGVNYDRWNLVTQFGRVEPKKWLNKYDIKSPSRLVSIFCSGNGKCGGSPRNRWNLWYKRHINLHDGKYPILWFDGHITSEGKELMKTIKQGGNPDLHW